MGNSSIISIYTTGELERIKREVEHKRLLVTNLQQRIEDLRGELGKFILEYNVRVGTLQIEIDKLDLLINEVKFRINWLISRKATHNMEFKLDEAFNEWRNQIKNDENETVNANFYYEEISKKEQNIDLETVKDIKKLYKDLVRRFHPDLAQSDKEKSRRHKIMIEINSAYSYQDINTLQDIWAQSEMDEWENNLGTLKEKILFLTEESKRLDGVISGLEKDLREIELSPTFLMWQRVQKAIARGVDYLQQLCDDLKITIEKRRTDLTEYKHRYEELEKNNAG